MAVIGTMPDNEKILQRRCPRLGGPITFDYCETCEPEGQPCWKILDCWWEIFDIMAYVESRYDEETVAALVNARPKPKIASLVELIEQARKRTGKKE